MENATGFNVGDRVRVIGGFEDGAIGRITEIDLSGTVKAHVRFTLTTDTHQISGLDATRLQHCPRPKDQA